EFLDGKLRSPDERSVVFASPVDASLIFTTTADAPATKVLISADPKKVKRVLQLRADIEEENSSGRSETGKLARVIRFMPFGRAGFLRQRARRVVEANLGKRTISITARGVVEGSMDGRTVFRKRMDSWLGYLEKDGSY
ncbi:unnamed protein product, partial [Pylaiella littoralis]